MVVKWVHIYLFSLLAFSLKNMDSSQKREKVVVVGAQSAGKTSLLVRYLYDTFDVDYMVCNRMRCVCALE